MKIAHKLEDRLFDAHTLNELKDCMQAFLKDKGYNAEISIVGDLVISDVKSTDFSKGIKDCDIAMSLCNQRKFTEAKSILEKVIKNHPLYSEAYRMLAQVTRELGKQYLDEAIDINIDALRLEPNNIWALVLMGNFYGRDKDDFDTGEKYFKRALEYHPDSCIPINNLAAVHMEKGMYDKAIPLFKKSIELSESYTQSYYGLANCYGAKGDLELQFETLVNGVKKCIERPENKNIRGIVFKEAHTVANKLYLENKSKYKKIVENVKSLLEEQGNRKILIEHSSDLTVDAKLEMHHIHHRDYDRVVLNPEKPLVEHLTCHELMHLDMWIRANKVNRNKSAVNDGTTLEAFKKKYKVQLAELKKKVSDNNWDI